MPSGVRREESGRVIAASSADRVADDPDERCVSAAGDERRHSRRFIRVSGSIAMAHVPDEMAEAADHVVEQREGVAEQHEPPETSSGEPLRRVEGGRAGRGRDQPGRDQHRAGIERAPVARWAIDIAMVQDQR